MHQSNNFIIILLFNLIINVLHNANHHQGSGVSANFKEEILLVFFSNKTSQIVKTVECFLPKQFKNAFKHVNCDFCKSDLLCKLS